MARPACAIGVKNYPMPTLSKSKIIAYRQCPKRLWLEVHRPELRVDSAATQASFQVGHQVGEVARQIYDPAGDGVCIDITRDGFKAAFEQSARLIEAGDRPVFEAGFKSSNTIALADVGLLSSGGVAGLRKRPQRAEAAAPLAQPDMAETLTGLT